jgi:phosphoglycerol geranylgeranyltransferase
MDVYNKILKSVSLGRKQLALLIDPDKTKGSRLELLLQKASEYQVDFIFFGGSLLTKTDFEQCLEIVKANTEIPVIIFPGNEMQVSPQADAILFLSLISGRNADLLIGKHVAAAPFVHASNLEVISTGYILVESGSITTALYMSNSIPVPAGKPEIAVCTALAGQYLGMKLIYLDAGSGAKNNVPAGMVTAVKKKINIPLLVGGGIRSAEKAAELCTAGADVIVTGTGPEKDMDLLPELSDAVHSHQII